MTLSKKDQIEIVLSGFSDPRAAKLGSDYGQKAHALSVTPEEIRKYVEEYGFPNSYFIGTTDASVDGTYIVEREEKFYLYNMDHGISSKERIFSSRQEALNALGEDMIGSYMDLKGNK